MKPKTAIESFRRAIGLNQPELAKFLRVRPTTFASYCRGDRVLPRLPCLNLLAAKYGVDPDSLVPPQRWKKGDPFQKPRTVTGRVISAEFCRKWKDLCQIDEEEIEVTLKQLQPVLEATLRCLSEKNPSKARVFLGKINSTINDAIEDEKLKADFKKYFERPDFGTTTELPQPIKREDLEKVKPRVFGDIKDKWLKKVAELNDSLPIKVVVRERPALATPDMRVPENYLDMTRVADKLFWEKYGLGSVCTTVTTYEVTQGKRRLSFNFFDGDLKVSKQVMTDIQTGESRPTPTSVPAEALPASRPGRSPTKAGNRPLQKNQQTPTP